MLDALIAQLPGAKIDENGKITVNGEFVESLLLNGKEFFKGDNKVMLDNIGAYTVKNIQVYKGHTQREKWTNDPIPPQHLTMDVKLKKEYSNTWIINAQGGYSTSDRYLGRLFASWFSPKTTIAVSANANDLNDNRQPGKSDSWTPESMPSGESKNTTAALTYDHTNKSETLKFNGSLAAISASTDYNSSTSRVNFLSSGNNTFRARDFFNLEFGSQKQFTIASSTDFSLANNTDMIGINSEEPQKYAVRNSTLGEDLIFTCRIGKQKISA